jgi:hypothetical protein
MIINLEIHIIYCIALVEMAICRLLLRKACLTIGSLLSVPGMRRKISYIVRKGEKQIQILDGY